MAKYALPVEVVSQAILEAVTSKSAYLRYLAGKDLEILHARKKTMSDSEFHDMMQDITR